MNCRLHCALVTGALLLAGCSILPKAEAPNVYLLPSTPLAVSLKQPVLQPSLRVTTPNATRALDSTRIAVVPRDNVINGYAGARWSDRAPRLLRDRLLDAFRADGQFVALSSDDSRLQADLELTGDLRAFQTEYVQGAPVVVIRYDAQLVQGTKIVAARRFDLRQPVAGKEVPQVVTAFGHASDQLATQVVAWVAASAAHHAHD